MVKSPKQPTLKQNETKKTVPEIPLKRLLTTLHSNACFMKIQATSNRRRMNTFLPSDLPDSSAAHPRHRGAALLRSLS
jgi:hypothetical protein